MCKDHVPTYCLASAYKNKVAIQSAHIPSNKLIHNQAAHSVEQETESNDAQKNSHPTFQETIFPTLTMSLRQFIEHLKHIIRQSP